MSAWKAIVLIGAIAAALLAGSGAAPVTYSGVAAGAQIPYVVPQGVYSIDVTMAGAAGFGNFSRGGRGARVTATLAVKPGDLLAIRVGAAGVSGLSEAGVFGGKGGRRGGGASSEIRAHVNGRVWQPCQATAECGYDTRIVVAAGGGAGGSGVQGDDGALPHGGDGGCEFGFRGAVAIKVINGVRGTATGGGGGMDPDVAYRHQTNNGIEGVWTDMSTQTGGPGAGSVSGGGQGYAIPNGYSGGGGGGVYSGGGGGATHVMVAGNIVPNGLGGGGGGTSGFQNTASGVVVTNYQCTPGVNEGDGYITISESPGPVVPVYYYTEKPQFFSVNTKWSTSLIASIGAGGMIGTPWPSPAGAITTIVDLPLGRSPGWNYRETVQINLGGPGWDSRPACFDGYCMFPMQGGWNGGGSAAAPYNPLPLAGTGGGGSSDIRRCANPLTPPHCGLGDRVVVSAGGGGMGVDGFAGGAAGDGGSLRAPRKNGGPCANEGCSVGGSLTAGGLPSPPSSTTAQSGALFWGGNTTGPGAGGGGGYYGGGAASDGRAAAGGSSYVSSTFLPGGSDDLSNGVFSYAGSGSVLFPVAFFVYRPFARSYPPAVVTETTATINCSFHDQGLRTVGLIHLSTTRATVASNDNAVSGYSSAYVQSPPYADVTTGASRRFHMGSGQLVHAITGWHHAQLSITGLSPATTYYYRSCAVGLAGHHCGDVLSFRTPASGAPVFTVWASALKLTVNVPMTPFQFVAVQPTYGVDNYGLDVDTFPAYLPPGLTWDDSTATISGTPTATGIFNMTVFANNSMGYTMTPASTIITVIDGTIAWVTSTPTPNDIIEGNPYNYEFLAITTPSIEGNTYSVTSGVLPPGLTLDPDSGLLAGTPSLGGVYSFSVSAKNGALMTSAAACTITVRGTPKFTAKSPPDSWVQGTAFSYAFQAVSVPTTAISYSLHKGWLPSGLTLNPTTGVVSGTPSLQGNFTFVVKATNDYGSAIAGARIDITGPATLAFVAYTYPVTDLTPFFNVTSYFWDARISVNGVPQIPVFSGSRAVTYSYTGTLPPGVTFQPDLGTIVGKPTTSGTYTFTVTAATRNGLFTAVAPAPTILNVITTPPTFTQQTPRNRLRVGGFYSYTYVAGTTPSSVVKYYVSGNSTLPPGMSLHPTTGVFSGTPTQEGIFNITVIGNNVIGNATSIQTIITTYYQGPPIFSITQVAPTGTVGVAYSGGLFTAYDVPATNAIVLSVAEGSLPSGLRFNTTTGAISGTPRAAGRFRFRVSATNEAGSTLSNSTEVNIAVSAVEPSPIPSVLPLAAIEPRLKVDISLVGGDERDLKQGSGELLREALIALGNNTSLEPVYTRLSVANLTTPVSALTSLGNRTSAVNGTLGPARVVEVPNNDPLLNRPLRAGSNGRARRLADGCQPVTLSSSSGLVTVPTTNASLSLSLSSAFYTQNNAVTTEQKTALLTVVQQQLSLAFSGNSSAITTTPEVQEFVNAFAACTGLPPALGVFAGFSNPVITFGDVAATPDSPSSNAGAIAGGIIGGLAGLFLLGLLVYFIMTSRHCCCTTGILVVAERHQCFTNFKFDVSPDFYFGPKTPITVEACEHTTLGEVVRGVVSRVGPYGDVKKCGAIVAGPDSNGQRTAITGRIFSVANSGDKELGALGFTRDNGAANATHSLVGLSSKPAIVGAGTNSSAISPAGASPALRRRQE